MILCSSFIKGHKFQWPREGLNIEPLGFTKSYPTHWTWENMNVYIKLEHDTIQVSNLDQSWGILNSYFMCAFLGGWFFYHYTFLTVSNKKITSANIRTS